MPGMLAPMAWMGGSMALSMLLDRLFMKKATPGTNDPYASRFGRGWLEGMNKAGERAAGAVGQKAAQVGLPKLGRAAGWGLRGLGPVGMMAAGSLPFIIPGMMGLGMGGGEDELEDRDKNLDLRGTNPMADHNAMALRQMEQGGDPDEMMRMIQEAFGVGQPNPGARMMDAWRII